jgi:uncharacterized protein YigE (DUF2233 family)
MKKILTIMVILFLIFGSIFFIATKSFEQEEKKHIEKIIQEKTEVEENIQVIKIPIDETHAFISYAKEPKSVRQWVTNTSTKHIVINGAYFLEDYTPAGYLVVDGDVVNTNMFDQERSGMLIFDNEKIYIQDLSIKKFKENTSVDFALQSYPFLIKNKKNAIKVDSGMLARRTAIGIDEKEENIYLFIVVNKAISLFQMAEEIEKMNMNLKYVLNLDGGPSTGIYNNYFGEENIINSFVPVSSVVVFEKK